MSILKSIMHHWNKTTQSYDTLHPETESAQITDWHSGIMASLASTTLGTVVSAVTTDSVLGKLIKLLLDASGVKYLIDTNGYVCFGSLFGGLIIQWGILNPSGGAPWTCALPISYLHKNFSSVLTRYKGGFCYSVSVSNVTASSITWADFDVNGVSGAGDLQLMISIGY